METTLIDDRFLCSEKTKKTMGHPISDDAEDAATKEINLMLKVALDKLKNNTYLNLEGGVKITWRDVSDIMEKNKPITNKVMDALTMFGLSNPSLIENATPRTAQEYLDAKFVSQLSRLFPKFEKNENKEGFVFPKTLAKYLCSGDSSGLYPTFADATFIYIPHHLSNNHWVGLCVDLAARKILVLDSNVNQVSDDSLKIELHPLAIMLPYLFKQASGPTALTQEFNFNPFSSERVAGVPQVSPVLYSGMVTVLLIKYHSLGCLPLLRDFDAKTMILEFKKLVAAFIGKYVQ